jgi:hypothetical protein
MITARIFWLALPRWLKLAAGLALAGALLFGSGYWLATRDAATRAALDAARKQIETHERIDNADVSVGDVDADRRWLFDRGN